MRAVLLSGYVAWPAPPRDGVARGTGVPRGARYRAAIVALTYRFCWAIDDRDWTGLRALFTPDASGFLGVDCPTVDAMVEQCRGFLGALDASHHLVTNHLVAIDGDDASCRAYFQAQHTIRGATGGDNWLLGGRYIDQLRRTEAGWRIAFRDLVVVWTEGNAAVLATASEFRGAP